MSFGRTLVFPLGWSQLCWGTLELPQGCQAHFRGSRGKVRFLLRSHSGKRPHLALRGESPGFSRVAAANVRSLSSYDGEPRDPLVWPQESPVSMRVARGLSGFLYSHCRGRGPQLDRSQNPTVPLQCQHGSQGSSRVSTGESGLVSCGDMKIRFCLRCNINVRLPVAFS